MLPTERWLTYLLRFGGVLLGTALFAVLLPDARMAAIHQRLGLGEYPAAPLTSYLTRAVSALYALHGVVLLALSTDVRRYRPVIGWVGWATIGFGLAHLGIDLYAGMPTWWLLAESPWILAIGIVIIWLAGRVPDER